VAEDPRWVESSRQVHPLDDLPVSGFDCCRRNKVESEDGRSVGSQEDSSASVSCCVARRLRKKRKRKEGEV